MAEPSIPPVASVDDAMARVAEAIRVRKRAPPNETPAQARRRSAEIIAAQRKLVGAARNVAQGLAGNGDGNAPASGTNGNADKLKEQGARPVRWKHVEDIMSLISVPINKNFQRHTDRIAALEARIAELEARPLLEDGGIWSDEETYRPGDVVTDSGTIWVCLQVNSNARPGQSECWRLMVKSKGRV